MATNILVHTWMEIKRVASSISSIRRVPNSQHINSTPAMLTKPKGYFDTAGSVHINRLFLHLCYFSTRSNVKQWVIDSKQERTFALRGWSELCLSEWSVSDWSEERWCENVQIRREHAVAKGRDQSNVTRYTHTHTRGQQRCKRTNRAQHNLP